MWSKRALIVVTCLFVTRVAFAQGNAGPESSAGARTGHLGGLADAAASVAARIWWGNGTLTGVVLDETDAAVAGVAIAAMHAATGIRRSASSSADGRFTLPLLPSGSYVVTAEHEGFAPLEIRNLSVEAGGELVLRIRLRLGEVRESVEVTAGAPWRDPDSRVLITASARGATGVRVGGELQRQLPLSRTRGFADALLLVPGIASREQGWHLIHGADQTSSVVLLDGADVTSNRQAGTDFVQISPETIEEIEVKTAGVDVSAPLTQGAVISVTTRSGGNTVRGTTSLLFNPRSWMGDNNPGGSSSRFQLVEPDASIGGPLRRDRWFFFGSYRWSQERFASERSADTIALLKALVPGWTDQSLVNRSQAGEVKLTGRLSARHEISAFYQRDRATATGPGGPAAEPFLTDVIGGSAISLRMSSVWRPTLTTRLSVAYNDKTENRTSDYADRTAIEVHQSTYAVGGRLSGTGAVAYLDSMESSRVSFPASKLAFDGDLIWYRRGGVGSHEVQAGFSLQPRLYLGETYYYNNNGFELEEVVLRDPQNPAAGYIPFHQVVYEVGESTRQQFTGQDEAVYLQDSWRPASRLTLTGGVRVDWLRDRDQLARSLTRDTWAVGPRASATWQVTSRQSLRAGWGRIHESTAFNRYSIPLSTMDAVHQRYDVDLDGIFEKDLYTPAVSAIPNGLTTDVRRRQPRVNEVTAGYRHELTAGVAFDLGLVRREFRAVPVYYDATAVYEDGVFQGYSDNWWRASSRLTDDTWNYPVVTDVTVQATRHGGRWQALASYTRNWRHLAGTWVANDPASFIQPDAFANNKGIGPTSTAVADSLAGATSPASQRWADHNVRAAAVYLGPRGIVLAGLYEVQSGLWSGPILTHIDAPDPRFGPETITRNGLTVSNPLATTVRFAYATRGEGQITLPPVHVLNLRLGHRLDTRWGRIDSAIDVFNPFNWDRFLTFQGGAAQSYSPSFGQGSNRQRARSVQVSARVGF
jgi:hypothetical protein